MMDWEAALEHFGDVWETYTGLGREGLPAVLMVFLPLHDRYMAGERTRELYDALMGVE